MPETDAKVASQAGMLANRLSKRYRHLRKWARRIGTDAFRLYDRDIPEIPLLLDIYGASVAGSLYQRPYEKAEEEEAVWLAAMIASASAALSIPEQNFHVRLRKRQRGLEQYEKASEGGESFEVKEGGLRFLVNLSDYLDTGLFLDHRATRSLVGRESAGKRVLNLFCYTGAFSVHAAAGNAAEVDSVDISNTYLDWAAANLGLNGFSCVRTDPRAFGSPARLEGRYRLVRADALRFLEEAVASGRTWDLIVLDPPTFSNSKKMEGTLDVRRDFRGLISSCLRLLAPGGRLWFSTNARGFKLDETDFPSARVADMKAATVDEDFIGRTNRSCYTFTV